MNWTRALIAAIVTIPLLALLGFGLRHDPREIPSPLPGRAAPPFALTVFSTPPNGAPPVQTMDTIRLADLRGKVVVLNFWASWCLECRVEHATLSKVAREVGDRDVRFYGVLYQDQPESGRKWIADMGGQAYLGLVDPDSRTAIDYGLYGVPETFFIGRDGRVAYKHVGPVPEDVLTQKILELVAQPAPARLGAQ
jgi:cytochrome c biogenesis protein CcmG/thiol:disulfide interchange protein DsbE